jgi:hypothetical protein
MRYLSPSLLFAFLLGCMVGAAVTVTLIALIGPDQCLGTFPIDLLSIMERPLHWFRVGTKSPHQGSLVHIPDENVFDNFGFCPSTDGLGNRGVSLSSLVSPPYTHGEHPIVIRHLLAVYCWFSRFMSATRGADVVITVDEQKGPSLGDPNQRLPQSLPGAG